MGYVLNYATIAPAADGAVGGAGVDAEGLGNGGVGATVEFGRE